jgi:hypothetical protein
MPKPPQKITVLPSVGKPDVKLAAEALLPLLESYIRNEPAGEGLPSRRQQPSSSS